jgi:hypothetical protein
MDSSPMPTPNTDATEPWSMTRLRLSTGMIAVAAIAAAFAAWTSLYKISSPPNAALYAFLFCAAFLVPAWFIALLRNATTQDFLVQLALTYGLLTILIPAFTTFYDARIAIIALPFSLVLVIILYARHGPRPSRKPVGRLGAIGQDFFAALGGLVTGIGFWGILAILVIAITYAWR